ncbi:PorP/SprF family type IX secretion system membrane protein [Pseudotamlana agarivorans]|uniref:PorP/SprF family type IX secretion system membrane protein n=1 Tax=Pseudotamlana agarivorans TaxID=481183 RepID=UPI00083679CB|nr:PorP/SprF family type IX secretion system membrane protein [Tamlana agarivorans]
MRKLLIGIALMLSSGMVCTVFGQQTPVFANYNYNTVVINPAHAGYYPDADLTLTNLGYFNQFEGSPKNIGLTFNTPLKSERFGLGAGVYSDKIGVSRTSSAFVSYAYKIFFKNPNRGGRWWTYNPNVLSFGITAGMAIYNENLSELNISNDIEFANNVGATIPTLGIGVLYNREHFYLGLSAPNLLSDHLSSDDSVNIEVSNPFYAYAGYRFYVTRAKRFLVKPSVLTKYEPGAPAQIELNTIVNYENNLELGVGYKTNESLNVLVGFRITNHLKFVYNYNQTLRNMPVNNTHGIVLSYRFGEGFRRYDKYY